MNWTKLRPSWPVAIAAVAMLGATSAIAGVTSTPTSFGDTFWVVPAADGKICLFVNGGGGGCSPASQIDSGTFSGLMPCAEGGVVHYGMLPNAATGASLTLSDHSSRALTITNNVWAIQISADHPQPTALSWTQSSSPHQAPVGAPPPPAPGATTTC